MNQQVSSPPRHPLLRPRVLLRGLALIAALVLVGVLLNFFDFRSLLGKEWIDSAVLNHGLSGEILFVVVASVAIAIGLPRQGVSFFSGYAFGLFVGVGLALLATFLGSLVTFCWARFLGREALARWFPGKLRRIDDFLSGTPVAMALALRLSPLSSNVLTNLAAGVSGVPLVPFFIGSLLGYIPQTIIFALLGGGMTLEPVIGTVISVVLFVASTVLGLWVWRRYRVQRGLPEEDEEEPRQSI